MPRRLMEPVAAWTVGNVLIVALWELLGDTVQGLDWVGRLLGALGRGRSGVHLEIQSDAGARYAIFRPAGARHRVRRLIMLGTPAQGTWSALLGLVTAPLDEAESFAERVMDAATPIDDQRGTAA